MGTDVAIVILPPATKVLPKPHITPSPTDTLSQL